MNKPEELEYSVTLNTTKEKDKFIKRIEKAVRSSMEYRDYIAFLKENVNMKHCAFFSGVENQQGSSVRIEIHHDPLTLYDIVETVVNKFSEEGIPLNDCYIADEVMELHYKNMVGLIPLSKSIHQIVHNSNEIFIPVDLIFGDYRAFIEEYQDYIEPRILEKLQKRVEETKMLAHSMVEKLSPEYVYVDVEGFNLPKKVEVEVENIA
jgi:hypothetical protein